MEMTTPLNKSEVPQRVRARYLRPLLGWCLVLIVTSAQVVAASYVSYYLLKEQLQNATACPDEPSQSVKKCVTRWILANISEEDRHVGEIQLPWQAIEGQVFTGDCTEYKEKSLEIKKSGFYFIYLQVMFYKNGTNVKFVMNFNGEETIQNSQKARGTVFFGSTYRLRAGTKIFVKSNPMNIMLGESQTFFGLFEL